MILDMPATPPSSSMKWSPQQEYILAAVADLIEEIRGRSYRVDAVAGAGKTTTLVEACNRMKGTIAFCAFNKKIADEIEKRVAHLPNITAGTFHRLGLRAWTNAYGKPHVDSKKIEKICEEEGIDWRFNKFVCFMVSQLKLAGYGIEGAQAPSFSQIADHFDAWAMLPGGEDKNGRAEEMVKQVMRESVQLAGEVLDFDDMLYMPLAMKVPMPQHDNVLIDEAQDTNAMRRMLARAILKPGGRVIAVGDPHQAIYGFTGADAHALDILEKEFNCVRLPLTVTYRCPKAVVRHAQRWVGHISAADTAPEGTVREISRSEFDSLGSGALTGKDAILCRNTRPLIDTALGLIRRGVGCRVEGRDIGQQLIRLATRWKGVRTLSELQDKLEEHRRSEVAKLIQKHQDAQAAMLEDRIDSLIAVIAHVGYSKSVEDLKSRINTLFADTVPGEEPRVVTLSTIHKAKGREWDRVYLLGRDIFMPSKYAKQEWELEQEDNLCYVAVTRAKKELIEVRFSAKQDVELDTLYEAYKKERINDLRDDMEVEE